MLKVMRIIVDLDAQWEIQTMYVSEAAGYCWLGQQE